MNHSSNSSNISQCPVMGHSKENLAIGSPANQHWWPEQLNLKPLRQNSASCDPMAEDFDYSSEFNSLDIDALCADLDALMTDSQEWWPADYGHYGPLFVRMAWHSAGTYRMGDGRGGASAGNMRFAPLNSWPDNVNLDKARQLLWPIKQKYGKKISWADLIILTGNRALETMGLKTFGFSGGRQDIWMPEEDVYWGSEDEWLKNERYSDERELEGDLGAVQMGLIYVNPEGPDGIPDPLASAIDIRETFGRMGMNDEETVALIAGGHTFGKAHGAADPNKYVDREPEGANLEDQGLGWKNSFESGKGEHTIGSGIEGAWTLNPTRWDNNFFENLFNHDWEQTKSPAGAIQWIPKGSALATSVPDAHNPDKSHAPIMTTADLALKFDPAYLSISKKFYENPEQFADAFAKAWYKLTHRDMGPYVCGLGSQVPPKAQLWQDPVPIADYDLIDSNDIANLKTKVLESELTVSQLVETAWASASTFRQSDKRGGANGARIRLAPQKDWAVNKPTQLQHVLKVLEGIQSKFNNSQFNNKQVSLADLIVLAGSAAVEKAAKQAGHSINVTFNPGRTDALAEQTDVEAFEFLEPKSDGFRNYVAENAPRSTAELLIDKSNLLGLSVPEMTILLGGMRVLSTNTDDTNRGVLTSSPGALSNDFFVNLLDQSNEWTAKSKDHYEAIDRKSGKIIWYGASVDLLFGSNSELRALAEVYASNDSKHSFVTDFSAAWTKVMELDRFDLN